jgi:hypothetical protein
MVSLIGKTNWSAKRDDLSKYPERFREVESALHVLAPNMKAQTTQRISNPRPRHLGSVEEEGDIEAEIMEQAEVDDSK